MQVFALSPCVQCVHAWPVVYSVGLHAFQIFLCMKVIFKTKLQEIIIVSIYIPYLLNGIY